MKTFFCYEAIFFFFLNLYNKPNLFCQGIIAHLQWNDRTLESGKARGWGEKKEENISQPFLHKVYVVWYWLFMLPTEMQSRHNYGTMKI